MKKLMTAFAAIVLCLAANAQNNISLSVSGVSLKAAVEQLKAQSGYEFIFADNKVSLEQKISFKVDKATIKETLDEMLAGTDVVYSLHDGKVILSQKISRGGGR